MRRSFRRKRNRLPLETYRWPACYALTIGAAERKPLFVAADTVELCLDALRHCCQASGFSLLAYCFMPDHLHLLLEGQDEADLVKFVQRFKQQTGYLYKRCGADGGSLWQKSYYDHVLRGEEDVRQAVRYILENPVRQRLAEQPDDYPFSGSLSWGRDVFAL
jgi:putative transposase